MSLGSEESITCLNQTLTLQNINEPCQYWVKSTPLPTDWIQISSTFTLLKHWEEYNQWGKPASVINYFGLCGAAVLYFLTCRCLLFPSVSARCQQLTNFRRGRIFGQTSVKFMMTSEPLLKVLWRWWTKYLKNLHLAVKAVEKINTEMVGCSFFS